MILLVVRNVLAITLIVLGFSLNVAYAQTRTETFTIGAPAIPGGIIQRRAMDAWAGRGGSVIMVTNLNNSGAGSLRACVDATGNRTCIFRVAGMINLTTPLDFRTSNIRIAGQTAPGGGITIRGSSISLAKYDGDNTGTIIVRANDIVMQYVRVRWGWHSGYGGDGTESGQGMYLRSNAGPFARQIYDHNSFSWAQEENIDSWGRSQNILFSNNIVSEGITPHSMGFIIGANGNDGLNSFGIDIISNYMVDNDGRNPFSLIKEQTVMSNLVYNWGYSRVETRGGVTLTARDNVFKAGADSSNTTTAGWIHDDSAICPSDNCIDGSPTIIQSNNVTLTGSQTNPLSGTMFPIVGAYRRLDCAGAWVDMRDAVDTRVIAQYNNNTGNIIDNESQVGGWPTTAAGTACADADLDGMPDQWETAHGFNPNDASDRNGDADGDGYTNLEEYLNGT